MLVPARGAFIIFGGTGDLARRKLLPALARLKQRGQLPADTPIVGVARGPMSDADYYDFVIKALKAAGVEPDAQAALRPEDVSYISIPKSTTEHFTHLKAHLDRLDAARDLKGNRAFYLALPPRAFGPTIDGLGEVGLNQSAGWTRLIIEKPFGKNLETARALNADVHRWFDESQIYRIDHYLGKETVQNLLVLRFGNTLFESAWNRDRVESIQITVSESLGVGTRAGYYDQSGALRDMIQNHITQLLTLVAMEVPSSYEADAIRYEKIKVLKSLRPIDPSDVIYGQYQAGTVEDNSVPSYLSEDGVPDHSQTETFAALRLFIDNWRWQGVPFYLRTGKRMGRRLAQIAVRFRPTPVCLFQSMGACSLTSDVLIITLQPNEGFSLHVDVKAPGDPFDIKRIPLRFQYNQAFAASDDAYQTLLADVWEGDQTLFVHADELERAWAFYQPLLDEPPKPYPYPAGSWGPKEADDFAIPERDLWQS